MRDAHAIDMLVDAVGAMQAHPSLDVACGPGLLAIAFAGRLEHATGRDTTKAMLQKVSRGRIGPGQFPVGSRRRQ